MAITDEKARAIAAGHNEGKAALDAFTPTSIALGTQGTPATTQAALTSEAPAAPAGGSGATAGAYDSAANRDIAITAINTNRTRIGEIEAALQAVGILT